MYLHVVVLSVFALASSGFTTILRECKLQQEMSCCAVPDRMNANECDQNLAPNGPSFESDQACQTSSVIGGLAVKQAVVEKDKNNRLQKTAPVVAIVYSDTSVSPSYSIHFDSRTEAVFLPSVGKYILNSSLLI
jgi:hypothetical protein